MSYIENSIPQEDLVAESYFSTINREQGYQAVAAVVASTSLISSQPKLSAVVAALFFIVIMYFAYSKGGRYRAVMHRYLPKHKGLLKSLALFTKIPLFTVSMAALFFIAVGDLNLSELAKMFI
ncbi:hypothetical protein C4G91_003511 [Vibrio parahaemolyticus]|nr:hypothetical protein [Vibrio parahaemolyticus]